MKEGKQRVSSSSISMTIEEAVELFNPILSLINDGVIITDFQGRVKAKNKGVQRILGYNQEELIGEEVSSILPDLDADWKAFVECTSIENEEERKEKEIFLLSSSKEKVPVTLSWTYFLNEYFVFIFDDKREKLDLEGQLMQAQKLEAIGQLAAGVAHEINTPLQYIGDNTDFLNDGFQGLVQIIKKYERLEEEGVSSNLSLVQEVLEEVLSTKEEVDADYLIEEMPDAISQSKQGVAHVVKIVQSLKALSHPGDNRKELIDLNKSLDHVVTVARNEWKYVSDLELDLDESLGMVPCFIRELNQVLLNIIVNAAHAVEEAQSENNKEKGKITIRTKQEEESVVISISDTGLGIPEEIQNNVFEPFFTTKEIGKGTGQGLAIAHRIVVEQHGGTLDFDSGSEGTTFYIKLPMDDIMTREEEE